MKNVQIRDAKAQECGEVAYLLKDCGLPIADIDPDLPGFWVAVDEERIVGVVGLESFGSIGLLRSLAVAGPYRSKNVGDRLYRAVLEEAEAQSMTQIYLLTISAAGYFANKGFEKIERAGLPEPIKKTEQFTSLCPDSAIAMRKNL